MRAMRLKVEAYHDGESWCARALSEDIFTQGSTLDELAANVAEAVLTHYGDVEPLPEVLLLSEVKVSHAAAAAG